MEDGDLWRRTRRDIILEFLTEHAPKMELRKAMIFANEEAETKWDNLYHKINLALLARIIAPGGVLPDETIKQYGDNRAYMRAFMDVLHHGAWDACGPNFDGIDLVDKINNELKADPNPRYKEFEARALELRGTPPEADHE